MQVSQNNNKRVVLLSGSMGLLGSFFCEKYYDKYFICGIDIVNKSNFAHHFIQADIITQAEEIVDETLQKFKRIDVLINVVPSDISYVLLDKFWAKRKSKNVARNRNIININYSCQQLKLFQACSIRVNNIKMKVITEEVVDLIAKIDESTEDGIVYEP